MRFSSSYGHPQRCNRTVNHQSRPSIINHARTCLYIPFILRLSSRDGRGVYIRITDCLTHIDLYISNQTGEGMCFYSVSNLVIICLFYYHIRQKQQANNVINNNLTSNKTRYMLIRLVVMVHFVERSFPSTVAAAILIRN